MKMQAVAAITLFLSAGVLAQEKKEAPGRKEADLGAATRAPSPEEVKAYALPAGTRPQGQVVESVTAGGPAEKAGVERGDVILVFDGSKIYSRDALEDLLRASEPGLEIKVLLRREKTRKEEEIQLKMGERASSGKGILWEYAGIERLDAALARAKKEGKVVLVGLSGAET